MCVCCDCLTLCVSVRFLSLCGVVVCRGCGCGIGRCVWVEGSLDEAETVRVFEVCNPIYQVVDWFLFLFWEVLEGLSGKVEFVTVVAEGAAFSVLGAESDTELPFFSFEVETGDFSGPESEWLVDVDLDEDANSLDFSWRVAISCVVSLVIETASGSSTLLSWTTASATSSSGAVG